MGSKIHLASDELGGGGLRQYVAMTIELLENSLCRGILGELSRQCPIHNKGHRISMSRIMRHCLDNPKHSPAKGVFEKVYELVFRIQNRNTMTGVDEFEPKFTTLEEHSSTPETLKSHDSPVNVHG